MLAYGWHEFRNLELKLKVSKHAMVRVNRKSYVLCMVKVCLMSIWKVKGCLAVGKDKYA